MRISKQELKAILRGDLLAFAQRCVAELFQGTAYSHNWHIEVIAHGLEQVRLGQCRRLCINVPPRSLKSTLVSVAFVAWLLGHDPSMQIICVSYSQDLADQFARQCQQIMASAWYSALFPKTKLSRLKQATSEFMTTANGIRIATSVGGTLTGRGADLIIIDDPIKADDALSQAVRDSVNNWYDNTLVSRLNNKVTGAIVLVAQRLHEDDLVGHVLVQEPWQLLKLAAIAEQNEVYEINTVLGPRRFERRTGEVLHPAREPLAVLVTLRKQMGEFGFSAQYQQAPIPQGGGMIKSAWFRRYGPEDQPATFDVILQSWDTANKATELSDYSVCLTIGLKGPKIYVLDVHRERLDFPALKKAAIARQQAFGAKVVLIEDKASGTQLIQELIAGGHRWVKRYEPKGEKIVRMYAQCAPIENGFFYLPREAPWLAVYEAELAAFPNSSRFDQIDATSQALDWIQARHKEPALITYYRNLATGSRSGSSRSGPPR
jgi:predicted phage terminase large subunit-like protein